ncbi:MAG: AIR synthase-related protein, partial [Candidatus Firestonebacteria bacterium]
GMIDPYWMVASNIDEAQRNVVAVGADIEKIAILDNFCWGNPRKPDEMGGLVRACLACYDIAKEYGTPFISGKDSLNNEYLDYATGTKIAIPGTMLISSISVIENIKNTATMDFKKAGNLIYIIGETFEELGGSVYYKLFGSIGNSVPKVDAKTGKRIFKAVNLAIKEKFAVACHDCSEGGLGAAVAEMAFAGGFGAELHLEKAPRPASLTRDDLLFFSESNTRFIVEVEPKNKERFETLFKGLKFGELGKVTAEGGYTVLGLKGKKILSEKLKDLKEAWQAPLRNP